MVGCERGRIRFEEKKRTRLFFTAGCVTAVHQMLIVNRGVLLS